MQPDNKPQSTCLNEQEKEMLSVMKMLSPTQKAALAQYLLEYTGQQTQSEKKEQAESSRY